MTDMLATLEFSLRLTPGILLGVIGLLLLKGHRGTALPWIAFGLCVATSAYLFSGAAFRSGDPFLVAVTVLATIALPYLLWLLSEYLFNDGFRPQRKHV